MPPKKARTVFVCQQCGYQAPRWAGQCPDCGEWNTLVEQVSVKETRRTASALDMPGLRSRPQRLREVNVDAHQRWKIPLEEFNRVLGGGIVPGSLALIGGDPGIGKSTLLLEVAALMAESVGPVLYVSAEESAQQIKMRADRLGINSAELYLLSETNLEVILQELIDLKPRAAIIDSIQTVFLEELVSSAGSVSQVRECASRLQHLAKGTGMAIFIVGHVTKSGAIAGPRVLEHIVDVVLYLEGDRFHTFRLLRSTKNRFGATNEVGVFAMEQGGMVEVPNPSEAFLADREQNFAGSTIAVTMEGSRPLLVEVQALTSTTSFSLPRRTGNGVDINRLLLMVAVLSKRQGMNLSNQDVFVNVVGGLKVSEPAADLSLAVAIASSYRDVAVPNDMAIMGEVGLSGELRSVSHAERRLSEAAKLGYKRCVVPHSMLKRVDVPKGLALVGARNVSESLEAALRR
jgi:DNA repair protein RadA/Sms